MFELFICVLYEYVDLWEYVVVVEGFIGDFINIGKVKLKNGNGFFGSWISGFFKNDVEVWMLLVEDYVIFL